MDSSAYETRRKQWRNIIMECNNSGMEKKTWCQQNGISLRSIYYWQKKLRDEALKANDTLPVPAVSCKDTDLPSTESSGIAAFVDMTDKLPAFHDPGNQPVSQSHSAPFVPELMISLNGKQIYVCANIQAQTLETVMKVVSHA